MNPTPDSYRDLPLECETHFLGPLDGDRLELALELFAELGLLERGQPGDASSDPQTAVPNH